MERNFGVRLMQLDRSALVRPDGRAEGSEVGRNFEHSLAFRKAETLIAFTSDEILRSAGRRKALVTAWLALISHVIFSALVSVLGTQAGSGVRVLDTSNLTSSRLLPCMSSKQPWRS